MIIYFSSSWRSPELNPAPTVCYPEEKNQTSIFILLHISNHWFLKTLCIKMESSYFTIKGPSHLTKHSYSYLSVSIFHCFINKNSEFCGHISSGLHLPGFTWPVIFFSGFYDWNWLKNGSLSPASECLLFYSSGYITHEITVGASVTLVSRWSCAEVQGPFSPKGVYSGSTVSLNARVDQEK